MAFNLERRRSARPAKLDLKCAFDSSRQLEIMHVTAVRADDVVVMMPGHQLIKLESSMAISGDHPTDSASLFEDQNISIGARLHQLIVSGEKLSDRHGTIGLVEKINDAATSRRVTVATIPHQLGHRLMD
jgi:hypothetical protein